MRQGEKSVEVFGRRLKAARRRMGWSLDQLVERLDGIVSKQALSKYENGRMRPSKTVMDALSSALDLRILTEGWRFPATISAGFRKHPSLSKKYQESLKFKAIDLYQRQREVENLMDETVVFENPLRDPSITSRKRAGAAAAEVRRRWDLGTGPIVNVLEVMENRGIMILMVSGPDEFDGLAVRIEDEPVLILNREKSVDRIRFTAAHELGHILDGGGESPEQEKLYHVFAGALLLPAEELKRVLRGKRKRISMWELKTLKETYGISVQAILHRLRNLGIISANYYRQFRAMMRRNGWEIREPIEYSGTDQPVRLKRLLNIAVSEEILSPARAAEYAGQSLAAFQLSMLPTGMEHEK